MYMRPIATQITCSVISARHTDESREKDEQIEMHLEGRLVWIEGNMYCMGCTLQPSGEYD